jgi:hypothetical protein
MALGLARMRGAAMLKKKLLEELISLTLALGIFLSISCVAKMPMRSCQLSRFALWLPFREVQLRLLHPLILLRSLEDQIDKVELFLVP